MLPLVSISRRQIFDCALSRMFCASRKALFNGTFMAMKVMAIQLEINKGKIWRCTKETFGDEQSENLEINKGEIWRWTKRKFGDEQRENLEMNKRKIWRWTKWKFGDERRKDLFRMNKGKILGWTKGKFHFLCLKNIQLNIPLVSDVTDTSFLLFLKDLVYTNHVVPFPTYIGIFLVNWH